MDNVGRILKDRHLSVNGLLALIHARHPDCGLPYSSLRRLVSHERKMSIDEAILICDALDPGKTISHGHGGNRRRYAEFDVGNRKTTWKDAGRSVHGT